MIFSIPQVYCLFILFFSAALWAIRSFFRHCSFWLLNSDMILEYWQLRIWLWGVLHSRIDLFHEVFQFIPSAELFHSETFGFILLVERYLILCLWLFFLDLKPQLEVFLYLLATNLFFQLVLLSANQSISLLMTFFIFCSLRFPTISWFHFRFKLFFQVRVHRRELFFQVLCYICVIYLFPLHTFWWATWRSYSNLLFIFWLPSAPCFLSIFDELVFPSHSAYSWPHAKIL